MRKVLLTIAILALPLVFVGIDGQTQETQPFWVTFETEFHAPPEFFTLSVFGNGGSSDVFNFGGLNLISSGDGFEVNQEFSNQISRIGNSDLNCDNGLQITGSAFFDVLDIRVGQRWEGRAVLGENRSICVDISTDNEDNGDRLLFEIRFRAKTSGSIFFGSKPDSVTAELDGTSYDPVNVLLHKLEINL